ncbi:TadE/TadG family type IV pilus assembly protein [Alkaliphilus peptidifermentans]|uniref:TadE-like protein n=1 Tax=Alkaliphilus peptidifermentans DSM 18978 TaxID=1120976 RepID=A0A1G5J859_9FIRM|nr:hypothetical protein [Alkaliphilus peptidifermentans]SCY84417.1 hypothetical protein SAMN03080606_02701 [Alkaliphilus peptidifermentans DSM 18978]
MSWRDLRKKGSITVEAAIVLPFFISIILTIGFISRTLYLHELIQHGITETANEVASIGYIYHKSGIRDLQKDLEDGLAEKSEPIKEHINTVRQSYDNITETQKSIVNIIQGTQISANDTVEQLKEGSLHNPIEELNSLIGLVGEVIWNKGKTDLERLLIQQLINKHLITNKQNDINKRLIALGVIDGWKGLDFQRSTFFNRNDEINIIVTYKINTFPLRIIKEIPIMQRVTVRAWMGGGKLISSEAENSISYESNIPQDLVDEVIEAGFDIWSLPVLERGRAIKEILNRNLDQQFPIIDHFENRTVESIRSHDTRLISNTDRGLFYQITSDIRRLDDFTERTYKGITIKPEDYDNKLLTIVIPDIDLSDEQIKSLRDAKYYGLERNITIRIFIMK